tara:strand:- start:228 stop:770 length:543 start_codon:yes stop_codon:yes gene_type:complete
MPLPFAPKPSESKVYQSLKGELVSGVTADQFDSLRAMVYAQGSDGAEDEYRRLLLLGLASNQVSASGPIPGSVSIQTIRASTSGTAVAGFNPAPGEVWQIGGFSITGMSGRSGSCTHQVFLTDGATDLEIVDDAASANTLPLSDDYQSSPTYIDSNITVKYECTGTFTTSDLGFLCSRVR